jgi:hypothetical protein
LAEGLQQDSILTLEVTVASVAGEGSHLVSYAPNGCTGNAGLGAALLQDSSIRENSAENLGYELERLRLHSLFGKKLD